MYHLSNGVKIKFKRILCIHSWSLLQLRLQWVLSNSTNYTTICAWTLMTYKRSLWWQARSMDHERSCEGFYEDPLRSREGFYDEFNCQDEPVANIRLQFIVTLYVHWCNCLICLLIWLQYLIKACRINISKVSFVCGSLPTNGCYIGDRGETL